MEIERAGSQASGVGPAGRFTGVVRIDPLFRPPAPVRLAMALVTFEPGARTAWRTHPLRQTLIVTAGCGLAQREGGAVEVIRPGTWCGSGRGRSIGMGGGGDGDEPYIATQEKLDGSPVVWLEQVSEAEYLAGR